MKKMRNSVKTLVVSSIMVIAVVIGVYPTFAVTAINGIKADKSLTDVMPGTAIQFTADFTTDDGATIIWAINGHEGSTSIDPETGLLTIGDDEWSPDFYVTATASNDPTVTYGVEVLMHSEPEAEITGIKITGTEPVYQGATATFTAEVYGSLDYDDTVNWYIVSDHDNDTYFEGNVLHVGILEQAQSLTILAEAAGEPRYTDTITVDRVDVPDEEVQEPELCFELNIPDSVDAGSNFQLSLNSDYYGGVLKYDISGQYSAETKIISVGGEEYIQIGADESADSISVTAVLTDSKGNYIISTEKTVMVNKEEPKNGFVETNGTIKYYIDNVLMTNYTGIVKGVIDGTEGWYYVLNGEYTKNTGIVKKADGSSDTWYYVNNGVYDDTANGLAQKADGSTSTWLYVENGVYTKSSGLAQKIDTSSDSNWYYVYKGNVRKTSYYTANNLKPAGIAQKIVKTDDTNWYYVSTNGTIETVTGIAQKIGSSSSTWYYVKNGVHTKATGLAQRADGSNTKWYYVK